MEIQQAIGVINQYAVRDFDGRFFDALFQIGDQVRDGEADEEAEVAYCAFLIRNDNYLIN